MGPPFWAAGRTKSGKRKKKARLISPHHRASALAATTTRPQTACFAVGRESVRPARGAMTLAELAATLAAVPAADRAARLLQGNCIAEAAAKTPRARGAARRGARRRVRVRLCDKCDCTQPLHAVLLPRACYARAHASARRAHAAVAGTENKSPAAPPRRVLVGALRAAALAAVESMLAADKK